MTRVSLDKPRLTRTLFVCSAENNKRLQPVFVKGQAIASACHSNLLFCMDVRFDLVSLDGLDTLQVFENTMHRSMLGNSRAIF
jgi:hypothetical protein